MAPGAGTQGGATKRAVLRMLQPAGELAGAGSAIVYCTYQAQASEVAGFLCTRGVVAAAYHAGMPMQVPRPHPSAISTASLPRVHGRRQQRGTSIVCSSFPGIPSHGILLILH